VRRPFEAEASAILCSEIQLSSDRLIRQQRETKRKVSFRLACCRDSGSMPHHVAIFSLASELGTTCDASSGDTTKHNKMQGAIEV
jgi:hypothetical protein